MRFRFHLPGLDKRHMKCEPAQGLLPDGVFRIPSTNAQVIDRYGLSLESFRRIRRVFLPTNRTRLPSLFIYRLKIYNPDQNTKLYFPQASPEKRISRRSEEIVQTFSPSNRTGIPRQFADPPYPDNIKATPGMQEVSARPTSGGTIAPKFQSETGV